MDVTESNHKSPMPDINETFIADRQMFWSRFTTFTMGAVIAVAVLLVGLLIFVA
jgi:hypothetical protein